MGMDALKSKAFEALQKDVLPRLQERLNALETIPYEDRSPTDEITTLIKECLGLLEILAPWAGVELANRQKELVGGENKVETGDNNPVGEKAPLDDMSDEAAMAALADMDSPPGSPPGSLEPSGDMSDEAAMAALAAMDAPASSPDSAETSGDMSDEAAMAALAAMDAPSSPASPAEPSGDMSDEAAMAALAAMDAPSSDSGGEGVDPEAMKMLEKYEGQDTKEAPPGEGGEPQKVGAGESNPEFEEEVKEIEEFGKSEFSSDPDMLNDFITNADELVENLDDNILKLEQNPNDKEIINEIFRSAHTLKGAAGMFAFRQMERIMHRMENYFDQIAKDKQQATSDGIDVILQGMDALKTLLGGVKEGKPTGLKTAALVGLLNQLCAGKLEVLQKTKAAAQVEQSAPEEKKGKEKGKKLTQSTIRVDLQRLDALVNLVGELVIDRTRFINIEEQLRTKGPHPQLAGNMSETVQLFGRHMNEVQDIIMKVRMVPIGNAFNKFSRVVRDLSKNLNKEIDLVIEGEHTELDKTIVEEIGDPLIHLIRNSVDHGVEDPKTREEAGKNPRGKIALSARQEGNQIMITIEDDGKGMDRERIRQKGIEKGLISEEENLTDRDIFNMIFEPGFSTAEKVTNISGRGVGMDVVKKQISKLKGVVDISSTPNVGTTLSIQLPLTLAIVQSLLVKTKDEIFAIPLSAVVESIRINPKDIQHVGDAEVIKRRNRVLPLLYLHEALDLDQKNKHCWYTLPEEELANNSKQKRDRKKNDDRLFVVVVGTAERRFGLVVDNLLNQQEMVIKSMGDLMVGIPCVAGGAILGNGEVVLVLDIGELEAHFRNKGRQQQVA